MKATMIAVALSLLCSAAAQAQVYKCVEGGRTVYSQEPCSHRAEVIDATPATGGYDARAHAQRRAQNARIMGLQAVDEAERDAKRRATDRQRDAERSAQQRRCDELRSKKQDAEYWSKEFRHPDNINREQAKAKKGASDLWWECGKLD